MGFSYLDGKSWSEVTRDERFFCMKLYSLVMRNGTADFVQVINERCGTALDPLCEWELGYEVCFYRDLWHLRGKEGSLVSRKRTFDLCLFSEKSIVILEAKCHEEFQTDQLEAFKNDRASINSLPGLEDVQVVVLGLASKRYQPEAHVPGYFEAGTTLLTWEDLAEHYGGDSILQRAGDIYNRDARRFDSARNTNGSLTGAELTRRLRAGEHLWVGRKLGLKGIEHDIKTGEWRHRLYQTNKNEESKAPATQNWVKLSELRELLHDQLSLLG